MTVLFEPCLIGPRVAIYDEIPPFLLSRPPFQHISICIYMQWLIQNSFPLVMDPCLLFRLHAIRLTLHKVAVKALLPDGSKIIAKTNIRPLTEARALVKELLVECLSTAFSTADVLLLLVLSIPMVLMYIVAMRGLLFFLFKSSFWPPRVFLSNTARVMDRKLKMPK